MKTKLAVLVLLFSGTLAAQVEQHELDPVTVTASLQPRQVSKTGRNILIFKGEEFSNLPVNSVDELLRYLPGLEVQLRGPMGSQSDIVLRGGTFQQVLVLLDGVRINDPNTGHFNSYIPVAAAEIERVEVLKGASSAIYGSEAVGGVIHIITRSFAARRQQSALQVNASVTGGEYDFVGVNAGAFYQGNNTAIGGGLLSNNTSGRLQRGTRGFAHNNTATVSVTRFIGSKWQLSLRSAYDSRDFAAQNFYTPFASDTASERVKTIWNQLHASYLGNRHQVHIDAGYKSVDDDYAFNKASIANSNKSSLWQFTARDEWKLNKHIDLISGLQVIDKGIRSNDRGNHHIAQGGVFVLVNYTHMEKLTILPAVRLEYNERSGVEWVPQLNLSYKYGKFQVRGSAGKTIRDADFTERFNNYNKSIVASGGRIGNPDLEAERSSSYEAGADYFPTRSLRVSGTVFQRRHRRLIDYVSTDYDDMPRKENLVTGGIYALARNISRVTTNGAELDIQFNHTIGKQDELYGGIGLVWLESKSSNATPSFYVSSHARVVTNFFAEWKSRKVILSVNGIYKRRSPQAAAAINSELKKEYFVLNTRLGYYVWSKRLTLFTRLDNVFDKSYSDLLGAQMPGRWWTLGVSFQLLKKE